MWNLLILHGVGACGGLVARRLRVPAGTLIGSMVAVLLCNALLNTTGASYPPVMRAVVQACSGAAIGSRFLREDVRELRQIIKPACLLMGLLFSFQMIFAFLIAKAGNLGMITSLFACAPGGVSDLALIAADFGADTEVVTVLQMFRFIFVVSFFPPFMKRRYLRSVGATALPQTTPAPKKEHPPLTARLILRGLVLPLAAACAGGMVLRTIGVPAGAIIGGMAVIITWNLTIGGVHLPEGAKSTVQICCGVYIGNQVTRHALVMLGGLLVPMLLVLVEVMVMAFGSAWILHKVTKLPMPTCLFSSTPGGIAEMGLIAEEMQLDTPKIVALHTCRVILTICVMPILVRLFS